MDNLTKKELWDTDNPPASNTMYICNLKKTKPGNIHRFRLGFSIFSLPIWLKEGESVGVQAGGIHMYAEVASHLLDVINLL